MKHTAEMGAIGLNSMPYSDASFSWRCTTSDVIDCLWVPTLEVAVGSQI